MPHPYIHLITLSALTSTFGGIVRPICFAVFRLMMNSNFIGCLHRQIGRLGTLQNFIHILSGVSTFGNVTGFVGHHATVVDKISPGAHRRQSVFYREIRDLFLIFIRRWIQRRAEASLRALVAYLNAASYLSALLTSIE